MVLSYFVGQRYYPIRYPLKSIAVYVFLAGLCYAAMLLVQHYCGRGMVSLLANTVIVAAFVGHILYHDFPLSRLPLVGKYFRR